MTRRVSRHGVISNTAQSVMRWAAEGRSRNSNSRRWCEGDSNARQSTPRTGRSGTTSHGRLTRARTKRYNPSMRLADLHARSLTDPEGFWREAARSIDWYVEPQQV